MSFRSTIGAPCACLAKMYNPSPFREVGSEAVKGHERERRRQAHLCAGSDRRDWCKESCLSRNERRREMCPLMTHDHLLCCTYLSRSSKERTYHDLHVARGGFPTVWERQWRDMANLASGATGGRSGGGQGWLFSRRACLLIPWL